MTPGLATRAWPAWRYDLQLAKLYAARLESELPASVSPEGIARAWVRSPAPHVEKAAWETEARDAKGEWTHTGLFHASAHWEDIKKNGFTGHGSGTNGAFFGRGTYFHTSQHDADESLAGYQAYVSSDMHQVRADARVKNPFVVHATERDQMPGVVMARAMRQAGLTYYGDPGMDTSTLKEHGYDGVQVVQDGFNHDIGGNQLVVFDNDQIRVRPDLPAKAVQAVLAKAVLSSVAQWAWSWLTSMGYAQKIEAAIAKVLNNLWAEGFAVGQEAGKEMLDSAYDSAFWDAWHPGDPDAAALTAGPGLQAMLQHYGIHTIKSVSRTRLHQLANVLAAGFDKGDSADTIADAIRPVLRAPQRAEMIATTELARATTLASVGEYRNAGQTAKRWSGTPDQRICPACLSNVEAGAIPIGNAFPSGAVFPPGHPLCRCAILPGDLPYDPVLGDLTPVQKGLLAEYLDSGLTIGDWLGLTKSDDDLLTSDGFVAGGLAVRAADTGRVLMIQRAFDEDDPAGGYWEFPGGRPENEKESVLDAAKREWAEETGLAVPPGKVVSTWDAGDYRGHVLAVASESAVPILDREKGANPDDPDGEQPEAVAWWDPAELKNNPAVRSELQEHPKRVRHALEATGKPVNKFADPLGHNRTVDSIQGLPGTSGASGEAVYNQLLRNYPPDSIEWVKRARWAGPYLVPWDKIDHDDMDSWAASHQPEKVKHFEDKIRDGDDPDPAVLVADPDGNYIDVDGHHRALAYHNLDRPIRSWIGIIDPADRHAMEETHLDQVHEGADPLNKGWSNAWTTELRDSHGRWTRTGDGPADRDDAITFRVRTRAGVTEHHSYAEARAKVDEWNRVGVQAKIGYAPGHDARHVSQLTRRVLAGEISQDDALRELSHAPKLQEKLKAHIAAGRGQRRAGGPGPGPAPKPKPDPDGVAFVRMLEGHSHDAKDMKSFLKDRSDHSLALMLRELAREIYDDNPDEERSREIRRLSGSIMGEQDRRTRAARRQETARAKREAEQAQAPYHELAGKAASQAEKILGGTSNYKRTAIIPKKDNPDIVAMMGWDGTMKIREDVAADLTSAENKDRPLTEAQADAYAVLLHEAFHSVGQGDDGTELSINNQVAYSGRTVADIEEGFTELGSSLHAPEFVRAMGVADRPTLLYSGQTPSLRADADPKAYLSVQDEVYSLNRKLARMQGQMAASTDLSNAVSAFSTAYGYKDRAIAEAIAMHLARARESTSSDEIKQQITTLLFKMGIDDRPERSPHLTLGQLADRNAQYSRLADGSSWGHYPDKVKRVERWLAAVANLPGYADQLPAKNRIRDLSDEVNRVGEAAKTQVMANQILRGIGLSPDQRVPGTSSMMGSAMRLNLENSLGVIDYPRPGETNLNSNKARADRVWKDAFTELTGIAREWKAAL